MAHGVSVACSLRLADAELRAERAGEAEEAVLCARARAKELSRESSSARFPQFESW